MIIKTARVLRERGAPDRLIHYDLAPESTLDPRGPCLSGRNREADRGDRNRGGRIRSVAQVPPKKAKIRCQASSAADLIGRRASAASGATAAGLRLMKPCPASGYTFTSCGTPSVVSAASSRRGVRHAHQVSRAVAGRRSGRRPRARASASAGTSP